MNESQPLCLFPGYKPTLTLIKSFWRFLGKLIPILSKEYREKFQLGAGSLVRYMHINTEIQARFATTDFLSEIENTTPNATEVIAFFKACDCFSQYAAVVS